MRPIGFYFSFLAALVLSTSCMASDPKSSNPHEENKLARNNQLERSLDKMFWTSLADSLGAKDTLKSWKFREELPKLDLWGMARVYDIEWSEKTGTPLPFEVTLIQNISIPGRFDYVTAARIVSRTSIKNPTPAQVFSPTLLNLVNHIAKKCFEASPLETPSIRESLTDGKDLKPARFQYGNFMGHSFFKEGTLEILISRGGRPLESPGWYTSCRIEPKETRIPPLSPK